MRNSRTNSFVFLLGFVQGETVTPYKLEKKQYPLVYAGQVAMAEVPKNLYGLIIYTFGFFISSNINTSLP